MDWSVNVYFYDVNKNLKALSVRDVRSLLQSSTSCFTLLNSITASVWFLKNMRLISTSQARNRLNFKLRSLASKEYLYYKFKMFLKREFVHYGLICKLMMLSDSNDQKRQPLPSKHKFFLQHYHLLKVKKRAFNVSANSLTG